MFAFTSVTTCRPSYRIQSLMAHDGNGSSFPITISAISHHSTEMIGQYYDANMRARFQAGLSLLFGTELGHERLTQSRNRSDPKNTMQHK